MSTFLRGCEGHGITKWMDGEKEIDGVGRFPGAWHERFGHDESMEEGMAYRAIRRHTACRCALFSECQKWSRAL